MGERSFKIGESTGLYEELFRMRDADRERKRAALRVVEGDKLPIEESVQGLLRWYLHPAADNTIIKSLGMYVQDIPPQSQTGRYHWQGGEIIIFLTGHGFSVVSGEKFEWEPLDGLLTPLREEGVSVQHFNPNDEPASFACVWPNLLDALGVDLGAGLEQEEEAPPTNWRGPYWLGVGGDDA